MGRELRPSESLSAARQRGASWPRGLAALGATVTAVLISACGTGSPAHFKNQPRPAVPVDLSVYMDNNHISISPAKVGAGPVILYITNQASGAQTLNIDNAHGSAVATSGHINSGTTAQISTSLRTGTYRLAGGAKIATARLKIGKPRPNADNVLLQP
jgi:hypothetical protein